jgi:GDP-4-dehydro-6-deoxy-D-mannose reductase
MCRLLTAVADWPVRNILCAGTFSEYVDSCEAWTEDSPLVPATTYGASKAAAWMCGRALALELGLPLVNLRLFHVYGPGESERRLVPYLYSQLSRRRPASLTSGTQVRDVVYVEDVAEACYAATMLPPATEPAVFNICSGTPVTIRQIGETVAHQLGVPASLLRWGEAPHRPRESLHALGDNRRFFQATGWQPRVTLADGIAQTLESLGWHGRLQQAG